MGRASTKENKNVYFTLRESLELTRAQASDKLHFRLSADQIERIENERVLPQPEDVLAMAEGYGAPDLCNYYCSRQCPIGKGHIPEVKMKDLSQIVLEMLSSLNVLERQKNQLIDITADGQVSNDEIAEFVQIQKDLKRIFTTVENLRLWSERMIASGAINEETYNYYMNK